MAKKATTKTSTASVAKAAPAPVAETPAPVAETPSARSTLYFPIWEDFIYEYTAPVSESGVPFKVRLGEKNVIYSGRAYKRPNTTKLEIRLNDIIADYLNQGEFFKPTATRGADNVALDVWISIGVNDWESVGVFVYDYSYDDLYYPISLGLRSLPIKDTFSPSQKIVFTMVGKGRNVYIKYFNDKGELTQEGYILTEEARNFMVAPKADTKEIVIEGDFVSMRLHRTEQCEEFCLYYVNSLGGWDSMLIQRAVRTDNMNKFTHSKEYSNLGTTAAGKVNYLNTITRTYLLHTGIMTSEAGERMPNLLESNKLFLHDLKNDIILPVIVTDTSCPIKTYKNGMAMVQYSINVEVARDYMRK